MSKKVEDIKQKVNQKHIEFYDKTLSVLEFMLDEYAREIKYAEFEFIDAPKNSLAMIDFLISAIGKVQKGQRLALGLDDDVVVNEETGCLYVTYHSENNSFPLSEDICHKSLVDLADLESALDGAHVGHCW